ncbi:uncharacterized protein LOC105240315 isoform X2 [Ailuropoda melanoleuca]|uniref:uncharacterized protein LOC105240315 isoform X2 n=1 Tax=Ailuropoda melanoleuca TaxID=9646 RepID=UPI001493E216|nr:uncharacterized protein LOC105240315 isoform X2 [Ailuropoda melanoleuca]
MPGRCQEVAAFAACYVCVRNCSLSTSLLELRSCCFLEEGGVMVITQLLSNELSCLCIPQPTAMDLWDVMAGERQTYMVLDTGFLHLGSQSSRSQESWWEGPWEINSGSPRPLVIAGPILTDLSRKNTSHRPGRGRTSAFPNMPMEAGTAPLRVSPLIDTSSGSRGTPGLELHLWKGTRLSAYQLQGRLQRCSWKALQSHIQTAFCKGLGHGLGAAWSCTGDLMQVSDTSHSLGEPLMLVFSCARTWGKPLCEGSDLIFITTLVAEGKLRHGDIESLVLDSKVAEGRAGG